MKNRKKIFVLTVFLALLVPSLVLGYHVLNRALLSGDYVFSTWASVPQNFRVDSGPLGGVDGLPVVEDACEEWNDVPDTLDLCGSLSRTSDDIDETNYLSISNDGINDVVFDEDGMILQTIFGLGGGILGLGLTRTNTSTGEILEGTLIINGSVPSSPSADLLATTIHEFGHVWGLAHTPVGGINTNSGFPAGLDPIPFTDIPTMFPFALPVDDANGRTLELDDQAIIKLQHPE